MAITSDEFRVGVVGTEVAVTGSIGPVQVDWRLLVDGVEVDSPAAAGGYSLTGSLPDGCVVRASAHQSLLGPTNVVVRNDGVEMLDARGFVT